MPPNRSRLSDSSSPILRPRRTSVPLLSLVDRLPLVGAREPVRIKVVLGLARASVRRVGVADGTAGKARSRQRGLVDGRRKIRAARDREGGPGGGRGPRERSLGPRGPSRSSPSAVDFSEHSLCIRSVIVANIGLSDRRGEVSGSSNEDLGEGSWRTHEELD